MQRIQNCLNSKLKEIYESINMINNLNIEIQQVLPKNLKSHCRANSFVNGCLTLMTSDSLWATELRFMLPSLREDLRKNILPQLISIKITIGDLFFRPERIAPHSTRTPLSASTRATILDVAKNCKHEPLSMALIKLANIESCEKP